MERQLDSGLLLLHRELLTMAGFAEEAVRLATEAWRLRSYGKIKEVYSIEETVNVAQMKVDDVCFKLLATQQPMANDLRLIIASIKINTDLERIVDLAVNIAHNTEFYLKEEPIGHLRDLVSMSEEVRSMMKKVIDAFVALDEKKAEAVILQDDTIDKLKNKIFKDVLSEVKADKHSIDQGLNVILIARNLERIGDHATNVAEDVIFAITGKDVRHPHTQRAMEA